MAGFGLAGVDGTGAEVGEGGERGDAEVRRRLWMWVVDWIGGDGVGDVKERGWEMRVERLRSG